MDYLKKTQVRASEPVEEKSVLPSYESTIITEKKRDKRYLEKT